MILLPAILLLLVLAIDLITDTRHYFANRRVDHSGQTWLRIGFSAPAFILFVVLHPGAWYWVSIDVFLMLFFVYTTLFDGLYNRITGRPFWFNHADATSTFDRFWYRLGPDLTQIFKLSGCFIFAILYLLTYFFL